MYYNPDIFNDFSKGALLTAGTPEKFNMMTIGWGGLGTVWGKPSATVYVRPSRYTHEFMETEDYFTIGTFAYSDYAKQLRLLGTKSGRDMDKMHDSGLTPLALARGMTFKEVNTTLVCKKFFQQRLDPNNLPEDLRSRYYHDDEPHDMYIGEVIERYFREYCNGIQCLFKEGRGTASNASYWKVCYLENLDKYSALKQFGGAGGFFMSLYEINKDIYDQVGTFKDDDYKSERLISEGRLLFSAEDSKHSPYDERILDMDYKQLCPWVKDHS